MDPLSVSASIIGVLTAAAKVSSVLITFVQNTKAAPKLAQTVLADINSLSAVLSHLQTYLLGVVTPSKPRASLILVEQVVVTLAECVTTFSELEDLLGTSQHNAMGVLDRMKWVMKESEVSDVQRRLQSNKSSLTLMLTILQCKSMEEAESAVTRLCDLVGQVLANNQDMSWRLRDMDDKTTFRAVSTKPKLDDDASTTSSKTAAPAPDASMGETPQGVQRNQFGFAFEEDLLASRVYRKPLFSDSGESLVTSAARTTASSILSALSLTDVSNISILAVPIYAHEICNSDRYAFGDFQPYTSHAQEQQSTPQSTKEPLKAKKWDAFASAVFRQRRSKLSKIRAIKDGAGDPERTILGVSLHKSITYANSAISLTNEDGESYIYGYVPMYVAKIGVFLKENATDSPNIFSISGSTLRLKELEAVFNEPPRYGKGLNWAGYTVHDAASILLRYLLRSPEPVVPFEKYQAFQDPLRPYFGPPSKSITADDHDAAILEYQREIVLLPPLSRQLLLYLLDLLAVFASKSETNRMTSTRLAAIFQPAILSPVRVGEDFIEESNSRRLSQHVVTFLIEYQDHFLIDEFGRVLGKQESEGGAPTLDTEVSKTVDEDDGSGRKYVTSSTSSNASRPRSI